MSNLDKLIKKLCPNGVEYKPLEDCCTILDSKRKPVTRSAREAGQYPYYGANGIQDYVSDYIFDGYFILVGEDGSVVTESGTPIVTWAVGKIWVNNHAHIVAEKEGVLLRYLYHYIQTVNVQPLIHGNIPKLTGGDFRNIEIPVPPLPVQEEIVRILDNFTALTSEIKARLTAELTLRKKQYEYYKNSLLNFSNNISMVKMKDISKRIFSGKNTERIDNGQYPVYGSTGVISTTNTPAYHEEKILIARVGANAGYVHIANGNYDVSDNTLIVDLNNNILLKYVYYQLSNMNLHQYAKGGGQPLITAGQLKQLTIPVPPLDVQERLVNVLDNFEAICSDLNIGLPAEIEARRKQYEYYRDKLLTFKEVPIA